MPSRFMISDVFSPRRAVNRDHLPEDAGLSWALITSSVASRTISIEHFRHGKIARMHLSPPSTGQLCVRTSKASRDEPTPR
jgi:hypothetical protein